MNDAANAASEGTGGSKARLDDEGPARAFLWAALSTARLTGTLLLRKRRILFLGLLVLIPALLPVVVAALRGPHSQATWGLDLYALLAEYGFLGTLVPLGAILLGTALMGDELEGGTSTYLLTRSAPRSALVLGKAAAYAVVMLGAFLPAMVLTFASVVVSSPGKVDLSAGLRLFTQTAAVVGVGLLVYGALCGFLGTFTQRPTIYSAVFVFGWEPMTRVVPGYVDFLTVKKHLLALWPTVTLGDHLGGVEVSRRVIDIGEGEAAAVLVLLVLAFLGLTTLTLRRKAFVGGQTLG
jgi:ABC-2 type transport system permease protein